MKLDIVNGDADRLRLELKRVGVDDYALNMAHKGVSLNVIVRNVGVGFANILKQEAIASGMDAAINRGVVTGKAEISDILLLGNMNAYMRLVKRLDIQPFGLKTLSNDIRNLLTLQKVKSFKARGKVYSLEKPLVMGILNTTPDSFSDGGKNIGRVEEAIDKMLALGVDIIDIGGASTRPTAEIIPADIEVERIKLAVKYAMKRQALVSVDTYNYETAEFAINEGVQIINDVTGLQDERMREVCSKSKVGVCIMHMLKTPIDMQEDICYTDVIYDIKSFFHERIDLCLKDKIDFENIILDVGFGFGKTLEQNYMLLKNMKEFKAFGLPILAGLSRKSMFQGDVHKREIKTVAGNTIALMNGADIIRVHDVGTARDVASVMNLMQ